MNRNKLVVGGHYLHFSGNREPARPIEVLDLTPHPGPQSGKKPGVKQAKRCYIKVRMLDTMAVTFVGTKGIRAALPDKNEHPLKKIEAGPGLNPAQEVIAVEPEVAPAKTVFIRYGLRFTVPAGKAGVIDTILDLLQGEGNVEVIDVGRA